jgi:flagellar FliL protein
VSKTKAKAKADEEDEAPAGGKKKLVIIALVVVVAAAAAWWFLLRTPAEADAKPKPGEVIALEPIQVNLAEGHYLSIGIALQEVEGGHGADGSKALDAVIGLYSGRDVNELVKPEVREELKKELKKEIDHLYHHEVMDVYLTSFVTQ